MMIEAAARDAFRPTADPSFFWRQGQYAHAFERLRAAVLAGGRLALLTGDAGTGKTTLANALAQELRGDGGIVGRLMYGRLEAAEVWSAMAGALGLADLDSREAFEHRGRAAFRTACGGGSAALLIVDEAHTLRADALIELERLARVLSAGARPVLSLLLAGLPELQARLESPECHGLAERIGTQAALSDLSLTDVPAYIRHRLDTASANPELLPADVIDRIATESGGTPACINQMCLAFVSGVADAPAPAAMPARPGSHGRLGALRGTPARIGLAIGGVVALALAVFAALHGRGAEPPPPAVVAPAEPITPTPAEPVTPAEAVAPPAADPVPKSPATAPDPAPAQVEPTAPPPRAKVSVPSRAAPPVRTPPPQQRQGNQPDPSDVIDWLLKEGSGKR